MSEPAMPPNPGSAAKGVGLVAVLNIAAMVVGCLTLIVFAGAFLIAGIGIVQCLWIVPVYLHFRGVKETETAKGILIGAGLTFLLNATCWGAIALAAR